ncbi:hypothetical protein NQ176_g9925 [Zarea fungicola]|uniref:Uncharacterized protein n=1 Tax=Zarea fungicola TaxID=93591 RepID=A0ACC1MJS8_9HYPO|nr:hypothetical protein NQ176_g9925 [Lecanicillium fungicola]
MYKLAILSAAFLGAVAAPAPQDSSAVPADPPFNGKNCRDIKVPVTVDTTIKQFNFKASDQEVDMTNLWLSFIRHGSDFAAGLVSNDKFHIKKDYTLAATLCHPKAGPSSTLQILTHGFGFDRSYWDYPYAKYNYSYVAQALDAGYSTLSWDRLGIAASSHGDPVNEIQLALELTTLPPRCTSATPTAPP